jgi:hypothetical protein
VSKRKQPELTWGQLLDLCRQQGKDRVLAVLEPMQRATEGIAAELAGEPETVGQANRMYAVANKQLETIIRLRNWEPGL